MLRITFLSLLTVLGFARAEQAYAWGAVGHRTIALVGSRLAQTGGRFWSANATGMGEMTNVPDAKWKSGSSASGESPLHWFQPDYYFDDPSDFDSFPHDYGKALSQYGEKTLVKNGEAPWRAQQLYDLAVKALETGDYGRAVQMAGTMSHYIGDLSQPLHVTVNYDGGETGDRGIHKFFETTNLDSEDEGDLADEVSERAQALLNDAGFVAKVRSGTVTDVAFDEVDRSYALKDRVIEIDLNQGRDGKGADAMLDIAKDRMADGAATLALVLSQMWQDAGSPSSGATVTVKAPAWVEPDFGD